jgi:4a-hydroxytetrahydrobiopterin dehydratase
MMMVDHNQCQRKTLPLRRTTVEIPTATDLTQKRCVPCEGGVPPLNREEVDQFLKALPDWRVTEDGLRIRREWLAKNFLAGIIFFSKVAQLADEEGHHPDLHLVGYRHVTIEIWTHAIGGLSENDFILAAKIDQIPIETKKS